MMNKPVHLFWVLSAVCCLPLPFARAEVPRLIHHHGVLVDSEGNPLANQHDLTFRLYTDPLEVDADCADATGACMWEEIHDQAAITDGVFSVLLGSLTALEPDLFDQDLWLAVTVDAESEMIPRQQITSVPFAVRAESAETLSGGTIAVVDDQVGIGTTAPVTKLQVAGGNIQLDNGQGLYFFTPGGSAQTNNGIRGNDFEDSLRFFTGAAERVTVRGGNVGIGTTSPLYLLDINGQLALNWSAVPSVPPTSRAVIWLDSQECLKVTFSTGTVTTLACK